MSLFSCPSPLVIPLKFNRKSVSAFEKVSMDNHVYPLGDAPSSSSPPASSPPLLTPPRRTPRYECAEWRGDYHSKDLGVATYDQQDKVEDGAQFWSSAAPPEHLLAYKHLPLPSLMTRFTAHTRRSDSPLSYSSSPITSVFQTTHLYPQRGGEVANDGEEYDLESMDIHIRETYFATSAERGRWLSSPIAPRVRYKATPPMRGHSSPVKRLVDTSPTWGRFHKRARFCSVDERMSTSLSEDRDENTRYPLSLPPSSPPMSPMSSLSFLGDDGDDDFAVDPQSNSDDCRSNSGTPELSISSTTCTSPVEPTRIPTPRETPTVAHSTDFPFSLPASVISRHTSPRPGRSPRRIDAHVQALGTARFEPEDVLSPLSQFELGLVEEEPPKLPLSDTVNKSYPGQRTPNSGTIAHAVRNQDRPSSIQSLSMNPNHELDGSLDTRRGPCSNKNVKRTRGSTTGHSRTRQTKKRAANRPGSISSDMKKGRGTRNHTLEPPSKLSRDFKSHGAKSRGRIPKVERPSRSPSFPAVEATSSESAHPHAGKTVKPTGHAQLQQRVPMDADGGEFHASLTGMLIEAFAISRATSMDLSALYSALMQVHPYLTAERSKERLLTAIAAVLEDGRVRCGMFDKVDSSSEKSRHKEFERRWFYVPERDQDRERASLISAIMPRQKRNETKKYKQYYYRPLDKICRWDPEDAP